MGTNKKIDINFISVPSVQRLDKNVFIQAQKTEAGGNARSWEKQTLEGGRTQR